MTSTGIAGAGSSFNNDWAAWAAGGDARILELPTVLGAGDEDKITIALSRIGAYTGPGRYELAAVATSGNPYSFPAIDVAGRTFSNGEKFHLRSSPSLPMAPGRCKPRGSVEWASIQVSSPDPDARVDLSMQWTCQEEK